MDYRFPSSSPRQANPRCLIVVRRDEPELCEHLRQLAEDVEVKVFLDRRRDSVLAAEGIECDRRRPTSIERDVNSRQYIIVPPPRGVLGG